MSDIEDTEVVIVGGGLTGLALACALGSMEVATILIDRQPLASLATPKHDGRVTAIARGSRLLLDAVGAWPGLAAEAQPILDIVVSEGRSPFAVRYDSQAVDGQPLGWIVPNSALRRDLLERARELPSVRLRERTDIVDHLSGPSALRLSLDDGARIRTRLLAVCEGRQSSTRERLGIGTRRWSYRQTGIVCSLEHEKPHRGVATERFFPDGPFAILPMAGGNRCSVVWALDEGRAASVRQLDDALFALEVHERFADVIGACRLLGERSYYPLSLVWADSYVAERAVLVGDAARGIHPIAGQGWNLALRDVAAIAEIVIDRLRVGLDPGGALALRRYAGWRRFDSLALIAVTDGINRLFANDFIPLKLVRNLGLGIVERTPPVKRFFMRHAMGLVGDLPRAMRGLPL